MAALAGSHPHMHNTLGGKHTYSGRASIDFTRMTVPGAILIRTVIAVPCYLPCLRNQVTPCCPALGLSLQHRDHDEGRVLAAEAETNVGGGATSLVSSRLMRASGTVGGKVGEEQWGVELEKRRSRRRRGLYAVLSHEQARQSM